jgi:hypothetical protein
MYSVYTVLVCWIILFLPSRLPAKECNSVKLETTTDATEYLQGSGEREYSTGCVDIAFRIISSNPPNVAATLLFRFISFKRPLNDAERRGIFIHGSTPESLYPAVHLLYTIGTSALPELEDFIASLDEGRDIEQQNALYTMLLIRHGDALAVVNDLVQASKKVGDHHQSTRLRSAANVAASRWCQEAIKEKCDQIQQ